MSLFSRTDQSILARWWWTVDRPLLACFGVLMLFGLVLVATASPPVAEHLGLGSYHFLIRHVIILVPTVCIMFAMSLMSPRMIWRLASLVFLGSLVAMVLVLMFGAEIKGAQRWLHIFGFSLQPSEFVKPAFAICAAWFMAKQKEKLDSQKPLRGNLIAAALYFVTIALVLMQPDLGMTLVITCIWGAQMVIAGLPIRYLIGLGGVGVSGLIIAYFAFDHVRSRFDRFFNPEAGDNYQVRQSLEAFQNGGVFGAGPGQGTVKLNLPDAHADFIFSVAGEELGLVFVLILIALFGFIVLRGFSRLMESQDLFAVLAVGGLLTMFGLQALVHMGSSLNILPAKGMTLPFISYGGSSLLSLGFSMGAVLGLTRYTKRSSVSKVGLSLRSSIKRVKRLV